MRIDEIAVEEFSEGEHRGETVEDIGGGSLLFRGGSKTGKTLTFNALLYNLLGARYTIDLAVGRQNKVGLRFTGGTRFFRGNPESEYDDGDEVYTGAEASEKFAENLGDASLIRSHFVHSHLGKMPLDNLNRSQRTDLIQIVTDDELKRRLNRFEDAEEHLDHLLVEISDERRRVSEELEGVEREVGNLESQQEKYDDLQQMVESGELADLSVQLQRDEELEVQLDQLFREKEGLRKQLRKLHRKKRKQQSYDSEVRDIIAEAVNDFVCPTCDRRITTEKAKNRINSGHCPYCGRQHSLEELKQRIGERVERSDEVLDELESEIEELQEQRSEVEDDISRLREERPEIGELDGFVKRRLDDHDHDLDRVRQHVEEELENIGSSLEQAQGQEEELRQRAEELENRIESIEESADHASENVEELREESFETGIQEFSDVWEEAFNSMSSDLETEIRVNSEGRVQFPGRNNLREYDRGGNKSGTELHLLNISFVCTLSKFATENDVTDWDTIMLDEPFSNLRDEEAREVALDYLFGLDKQLIVTSSDESLDGRFDTVEVLEREPLQTRISDFV